MPDPEYIIQEKVIKKENGITFLSNERNAFEDAYIKTRQKEGWLYDTAAVRKLPATDPRDPLYAFWKKRKASAENFIRYLKTKNEIVNILEVGCGNGWFTGLLATSFPQKQFAALDINKTELQIAAAAFQQNNINWFYGDLRDGLFMLSAFDLIVFNASIQYFNDLQTIIRTALIHLKKKGEVHIIDSPFYSEAQHIAAANATNAYYSALGADEMSSHYFHHTKNELRALNARYLYTPGMKSKLIAALRGNTYIPFQWISISK